MAMELYFYFKITHFGPALDLEWHLEEASMASGHVLGWIAIYKTKILVHYEFKVHINVVGRGKK